MWRFLCLTLLAEVSSGRVLEVTEKKPVILTHDKLKTDAEGKDYLVEDIKERPVVTGELEESIPEKLLSYKLEEFLDTIDIDKRRKVCILGVHRTIYHLAEYKKTGELPEPVLKNKRKVKRLIKKVMNLPVKFDIREEEEDIKEVEMEMNLPFTRLTSELRKMKRELVRECGDKYPVFE